MADEVMEILRNTLVDSALDRRDWSQLKHLTSPGWEDHVVGTVHHNPFAFLRQDEHFLECRMIDGRNRGAILNYRYQHLYMDILFIGEIRIPIQGNLNVDTTYAPKRKSISYEASPPSWLLALADRAEETLAWLYATKRIPQRT